MECGAKFSACMAYRYTLWRRWGRQKHKNQVMFIGLNPSTADETKDDPTVRRCIRFSRDWGYSGLIMMNAYAFRATKPKVMKDSQFPVGPDNDKWLRSLGREVIRGGGVIIAAWGTHCVEERELQVCEIINRPIQCL